VIVENTSPSSLDHENSVEPGVLILILAITVKSAVKGRFSGKSETVLDISNVVSLILVLFIVLPKQKLEVKVRKHIILKYFEKVILIIILFF